MKHNEAIQSLKAKCMIISRFLCTVDPNPVLLQLQGLIDSQKSLKGIEAIDKELGTWIGYLDAINKEHLFRLLEKNGYMKPPLPNNHLRIKTLLNKSDLSEENFRELLDFVDRNHQNPEEKQTVDEANRLLAKFESNKRSR